MPERDGDQQPAPPRRESEAEGLARRIFGAGSPLVGIARALAQAAQTVLQLLAQAKLVLLLLIAVLALLAIVLFLAVILLLLQL